MTSEIDKHIQLLKEQYALDISMFDRSYLEKAIQTRMTSTLCETSDNYLHYMGNMPDEPQLLLGQLSNSHSEFFRNALTFSMLEQIVIPKILDEKGKTQSGEIRVWSAGCASGQEPYSLAMLLDDFKNTRFPQISFRIFATDNSVDELSVARKGVFGFKTVKNTKLRFAEKYFQRTGDECVLVEKLKKKVDFSEYDLLDKDSSSPPSAIYGDFDLIMCCNVLFYYQPEVQQMILRKFHRSLKHGGFFITGEAENQIVNSFGGFRQYAAPAMIFVKS